MQHRMAIPTSNPTRAPSTIEPWELGNNNARVLLLGLHDDSMSTCQIVKRSLPDSQPNIRGPLYSGEKVETKQNCQVISDSPSIPQITPRLKTSGALMANRLSAVAQRMRSWFFLPCSDLSLSGLAEEIWMRVREILIANA